MDESNKLDTKEYSNRNSESHNENDGTEKMDHKFISPSIPSPNKLAKSKPTISIPLVRKVGVPADIYKTPTVISSFIEEPTTKSTLKPENQKVIPANLKSKNNEKAPPPVLMYEKPDWSEVAPEDTYFLEVLKNGSIVKKINLSKKEFFTIGRLADCDISLEHPLISRYHAVLQYGAPKEDSKDVELQKDGTKGIYLYDIGSTHGSFLNKVRSPINKYFRVKVGHTMKFGGSTRLFILQGPSDDMEEEAKESVSQLKELYKEKQKKDDLAKKMLGEDEEDSIEDMRTRGQEVSWGMPEDAETHNSSDEEDDGDKKKEKINPFEVPGKERFYVKDPVKALKHFYDQERIEIEFEYTERRPGHWHCRLELPIDGAGGRALYAEATVTGKKKDAASSCALDACKILDREGYFQQSEHHKKKVKQWKEDDYYDSDEDQFLDRTGEIEKKRQQRMRRTGKNDKSKPETYESLCAKVKALENEISNINSQLSKDKEVTKIDSSSTDPLEDFMKQIKSGKALDTVTRSKLKVRLVETKKELAQSMKLADLARPASMPSLLPNKQKSFSFIGKMKGKKKLGVLIKSKTFKVPVNITRTNNDDVEEEDDDDNKTEKLKEHVVKLTPLLKKPSSNENIINSSSTGTCKSNIENKVDMKIENKINANQDKEIKNKVTEKFKIADTELFLSKSDFVVSQKNDEKFDKTETKSSKSRVMGPTLPAELRQKLLDDNIDSDMAEPEPKKKRRERIRKPKSNTQTAKDNLYDDSEAKYINWVPPKNQSGDGTTSLNAKLGY